MLVLHSACHNKWSSNDVTSSPRKFQTATVWFLNVRNSWFSYRKINADGVINSVLSISFNSAFRTYERGKLMTDIIIHIYNPMSKTPKIDKYELTSRIWRFSFSCLTRSFSLNCSIKSTFWFRWSRWLKSLRTVPSSIDSIFSGMWPWALVKINNMMPGLLKTNKRRGILK